MRTIPSRVRSRPPTGRRRWSFFERASLPTEDTASLTPRAQLRDWHHLDGNARVRRRPAGTPSASGMRFPIGHAAFVGAIRRTVGLLAVAAVVAAVVALLRHAPLGAAVATVTAVVGLVWLFRTER